MDKLGLLDLSARDREEIDLPTHRISLDISVGSELGIGRFPQIAVKEPRLSLASPSSRIAGSLALKVSTEGWRFPHPLDGEPEDLGLAALSKKEKGPGSTDRISYEAGFSEKSKRSTRLRPPPQVALFKDRLLYILQPPLENLFAGKRVDVPFNPYPYQLEGIAFLMPRHGALLADEMGLGKTMQAILAMRLLFHSHLAKKALIVCPKPLVINWARELSMWAPETPVEVIGGDWQTRRSSWLVSNCPVKLVNYEILTRDIPSLMPEEPAFDLVILDEAQRIKTRNSKTAQVVRGLSRNRSWALTGTPVENRTEDLVNILSFVDAGPLPVDSPPHIVKEVAADCLLRRTKDDVQIDLPSKTIRDAVIELTPAQCEAYGRAENQGIVHLNELGDTVTVRHVFELVMRLKQICNFDPASGQSAKLEQLEADLAEVAASGRKALVFSQWVEPLLFLARKLAAFKPLQFHGRLAPGERQAILEKFVGKREFPILLMTYGSGSVGLNLQCANYVFLFDRWWNPAVEDQAINRVHRIGQKDPVFISRYVTAGTIEMRIAEILDSKRRLFNEIIPPTGSAPRLGLSEEEIFGLFNIKAKTRRTAA